MTGTSEQSAFSGSVAAVKQGLENLGGGPNHPSTEAV
jgi:hypothetical protein